MSKARARQVSADRRGSSHPWLFGIQARIFLAMALLAAVLLTALSVWIERQARQEMENELTEKLQAVGGAAVSVIGPGLVPALTGLSSAQAGFAFYQDRRTALTQLRDRTRVRRIFLADTTGRSFLDTDLRIGIGTPLPQLRSDRLEMQAVRAGKGAAAALFTDDEGRLRKTGYVPVLAKERVIAVVGVEGEATFLDAVRKLRTRILTLGAAGILLAFVIAAPLARGLTRPLHRLVQWARKLEAGDLSPSLTEEGRDEISLLGRTLEQMRVRLQARDREQRAMVAGVAHEIRNPLSGMRLYAELLAADPSLRDTASDRVGKILRELGHLSSIVEEFLLYARPEAAHALDVELGEVLEELIEWIRPEAEKRGVAVTLEADISAASGLRVRCDPTHLRQILRNLIQNAVEASEASGKVAVIERRAARGIEVVVEDEGPGISPEDRERIFEPFFTTKAAGAGLGLPIVRRLAVLNEGQVSVESGGEGGARFVVSLTEAP